MSDDFMTRLRARCRARGFTLVELMITIGVAAILAMIAVPSFQHLMLSNKLTTAANAMVGNINLARLDAIKLNAATQFCGTTTPVNSNNTDTLGAACTTPGAVYASPHSGSTVSQVQMAGSGIASPIQVTNAGIAAVRFSGQGFGYAPTGSSNTPFGNTVAIICTSELASNNQRIVSMTGGAILATASSTGTCP